MFKRGLALPRAATETFFLWGPRQTGKTTLLRQAYPDAFWIDLLKADEFRRYMQNPETLREQIEATVSIRQVVVDEVQKVPRLLDEVHWLHENRGIRFALCGSSARKVKRGQANLLGGRALRYELHGLTAAEIGRDFDLDRMLNHGYLPNIYQSTNPRPLLNSYVADYLKEEVAAEGLVRNLPVYSEFLSMAALADAEQVNFSTIARDCGVSSHTIKGYFQILEDTLLGRWLPAYTRRPKRRVIAAPKFYFGDVGIVNQMARRGTLQSASELYGKAFENWVFHELCARNAYSNAFAKLAYWRLPSGIEVDFIVNEMQLAIEAKATAKVTVDHLKGLGEVGRDHRGIKQRIIVCLERASRKTDDGIWILPASEFCARLSGGDLF